MSGHSKWSKVKHQKAVTDVVKAKAFTKASRAITIAVKEGAGVIDPLTNFRLRLAIEKAKEVNMPKENIDRAIAKGKGEGDASIESYVYEAYGPEGVAFIIETATENKQRTVSMVKNIFEHHGGSLAAPGAVAYQFKHVGMIVLERPISISDDELFTQLIEFGASDVVFYDDAIEVTTDVTTLESINQQLTQRSIPPSSSELVYIPSLPLEVSSDVNEKIETIIELLTELDDVQRVYTNI
jgi:YebC/PmpR family DNA-binding regulatory protein